MQFLYGAFHSLEKRSNLLRSNTRFYVFCHFCQPFQSASHWKNSSDLQQADCILFVLSFYILWLVIMTADIIYAPAAYQSNEQ